MQCPKCNHEPGPDQLLASPCTACGWQWVDTYQYVHLLAGPVQPIKSVLDIGCGNKGIIGQHYWETVQPIERGFACDVHVIKELPDLWTPLLMDAEDLLQRLGPKSVDFVTHCGFLEHVPYHKALRILHVIEQVARKRVFFTCSAILREVDYKCRMDGNPWHAYCSFWDAAAFEALGYTVDRARMRGEGGPSGKEATFSVETAVWFDVEGLPPWGQREAAAREVLAGRRCVHPGCRNEPILWDAHEDCYYCIDHAPANQDRPDGYDARKKNKGPLSRWRDRDDFCSTFPHVPWREPWPACNDDPL